MSTTRRSEQWDGRAHIHTQNKAEGRLIFILYNHAEVIRCEHNKMVYYFHVRRIQNLLQMIMAPGFPARAEEGISRATGVVRLIFILVQNDREGKNKNKTKNETKTLSADSPCPCGARASPNICRSVTFMM